MKKSIAMVLLLCTLLCGCARSTSTQTPTEVLHLETEYSEYIVEATETTEQGDKSDTVAGTEIAEETSTEYKTVLEEPYEYEVTEKVFSFESSEEGNCEIPYVEISGCPDSRLEWEVNHTLFTEAC